MIFFDPSLGNKPFKNTVGKGEIAHNEQFLLYPVFSTSLENFLLFTSNSKLSSADCFNLDQCKILLSVNGISRGIVLEKIVVFVFTEQKKSGRRVPKGTSEYQASWIVEDDNVRHYCYKIKS